MHNIPALEYVTLSGSTSWTIPKTLHGTAGVSEVTNMLFTLVYRNEKDHQIQLCGG